MYFLEVLGTFWPDAKGLQPYSLFHYYQPKEILEGTAPVINFALPAVVAVVAIAWAARRVPAPGPRRPELSAAPPDVVPARPSDGRPVDRIARDPVTLASESIADGSRVGPRPAGLHALGSHDDAMVVARRHDRGDADAEPP